jgi:hypothetical protein
MKRCKLKMTVVVTYEAEFEDDAALSAMIESLKRDPYPGTALSVATERWRVRLAERGHVVEELP